MICPYCKNEKLQAEICPSCGLGEKEALLKTADHCWNQGKQELALDYYGRYLTLEPGDFEAACKLASCLFSMALNRRDPLLFEKADRQIAQILENHWDWQSGHDQRLNLSICFGKLDSLRKDYAEIREKDPARAAVCDRMIRMIQLSERFRDERPEVPKSLEEADKNTMRLESFWIFGVGILVASALTWILIPLAQKGLLPWPIAMGISIVCFLAIIFLRVWRVRRINGKEKSNK
jgi:tetratricopeptide (TPR) repeat protein